MRTLKSARTSSRQKRCTFLRWILYGLLVLFAFVIAAAGNHIKPLLLIPIALCISSTCKDVPAVGVGIVCGFLLDISCGKLLGYNAIILLALCLCVSLLYTNLLQQRLLNMLVLTAVGSFLQAGLDFFFSYVIWGYDHVNQIFLTVTIPSWLATVIATIPIYYLFRLIAHCLSPKQNRIIRESTHS